MSADATHPNADDHRPAIAASVDSGLAGLLSMVLSSSRDEEASSPAAGPGLADPHTTDTFPAEDSLFEVSSAHAPAVARQIFDEPTNELVHPPFDGTAPAWEPPPPPPTQRQRLEPGGIRRLRQAVDEDVPQRALTAKQLTALLDGLSRLTARPGEEGLPPALLLLDIKVKGSTVASDGLYAVRSQIDNSVRAGDVAMVVPDLGVALFCGGLFFPGDLEVMGARVRRRALDRSPTVLTNDEVQVVVAGALSKEAEDPITFLNRGVWAFDQTIRMNRQDIVIDYGDQLLDRFA
jgi:hypothetical protein